MRWGGGEKLLGRSRAPPPPLALSPPPWKATENPEVAVGGPPSLVQSSPEWRLLGRPWPSVHPGPIFPPHLLAQRVLVCLLRRNGAILCLHPWALAPGREGIRTEWGE